MPVILIAAQKGGVGKSTLAVHFASLADKAGKPSLLIDCDQQGSSASWYERREAETPVLAKVKPSQVPDIVKAAKADGIEHIVIDSPPHDAANTARLMGVADVVLIPTRPGPFDLHAVSATIEAARAVKANAVCLINHGPPGRGKVEPSIVAEARTLLEGMGATVLPGFVAQRASLSHSLITGQAVHEFEAKGRAAAEIAAAWEAVQKLAKGKKSK